ncbi:serine/threonine protein kinase [Alkalihalobacillus sp. LMS6]|uniref:protein kinase domain-containing protein n=1 Tax=Alkalihalobacillus sp. LMS6 TaxID=2924034 RepID=UPI0020D0D6E7|nr:serine/threonine protein kinase [Alkalihalobacillus sp. LMS6]UTR07370.1 serine/threonine protein kinase [Alkalihalobacillus sp. LMS6]
MEGKFVTQSVDGQTFQLKELHDFQWLQSYGTVFNVFDQQDSGNLSFGVKKGTERYFIKYAGAKTIYHNNTPSESIQRLKEAERVYRDLQHPSLIQFIEAIKTPNGYGLVFAWTNGENLYPHWEFPPPKKYTHPDSPFYRFRQLPFEKKSTAFKQILSFHKYVEEEGYVLIDFYDGSLLYNFTSDRLTICDIDMYAKVPYTNEVGRMWGSSRFMAPEEFEKGATIDRQTMVYTMGAMAFALFGGETDRSLDKWQAPERFYSIARKAVQTDKSARYGSVGQFLEKWLEKE